MGKPGTTKMVNLGPKQKYGLKMDHGAKQMSKTDKGINYMMGAATPQKKTGLYQDRMDGKLPQNPMLMQYGMSDKAVKQVGKHIAIPQVAEEGEPLKPKPTMKAAENVSFSSLPAVKAKSEALKEGYRTESIKTKGNVRSTVMELKTPKPKTSIVEEPNKPSKQYAGTYVKRKFLPGYKSVKSESAKEAYTGQKRKGNLTEFENVNKRASRG